MRDKQCVTRVFAALCWSARDQQVLVCELTPHLQPLFTINEAGLLSQSWSLILKAIKDPVLGTHTHTCIYTNTDIYAHTHMHVHAPMKRKRKLRKCRQINIHQACKSVAPAWLPQNNNYWHFTTQSEAQTHTSSFFYLCGDFPAQNASPAKSQLKPSPWP